MRAGKPVRLDIEQLHAVIGGVVRHGGAGHDSVLGSDSTDLLIGGTGDDTVNAGGGNDHVDGEWGDDSIVAGAGNDTAYGGLGDDTIYAGAGRDLVFAGTGDDRVVGGSGNDTVWGDAGQDTLVGQNGDDDLAGGAGNDILQGDAGDDHLAGGAGRDTLLGGSGEDTILGGAGSDDMRGGTGDDILRGGSDVDIYRWVVGDGNDTIIGGEDRDILTIDSRPGEPPITLREIMNGLVLENTTLNASDAMFNTSGYTPASASLRDGCVVLTGTEVAGTLTIRGQTIAFTDLSRIFLGPASAGSDEVPWGADLGFDAVGLGSPGQGTADDDSMVGGAGRDELGGDIGDDQIEGGAGNDLLAGDEGNDTLLGGAGADELAGGQGADVLDGGEDFDLYRWVAGDGDDTIIGSTGNTSAGSWGDALTIDCREGEPPITAAEILAGLTINPIEGQPGDGPPLLYEAHDLGVQFVGSESNKLTLASGTLTIRGQTITFTNLGSIMIGPISNTSNMTFHAAGMDFS